MLPSPHRRAVLSLLPAALLAAAACAGGRSARSAAGPLVVGSDLDNAPFAWVDEDGVPRGRDVEMMGYVAGILGRELVWRRLPFEDLLDAAASGRVDVVCATLGATPERAERVLFSPPYFETELAVVVRSGPGEPRAPADLAGRPVAASAGTTSEAAAREHLASSHLVTERKGRTSAELLLEHVVDAIVMDGPAADSLVASHGGRLVRLGATLAPERYALAMPPFQVEEARALSRAVAALREEGVLARLDRRFGLR